MKHHQKEFPVGKMCKVLKREPDVALRDPADTLGEQGQATEAHGLPMS